MPITFIKKKKEAEQVDLFKDTVAPPDIVEAEPALPGS